MKNPDFMINTRLMLFYTTTEIRFFTTTEIRFFTTTPEIFKDNRDNKNNGKNRCNCGCHEVTLQQRQRRLL